MLKTHESVSWLSDVPLPAKSEGHRDGECEGPAVPQAGRPEFGPPHALVLA